MPTTIGSLTDVPSPGDPITSPWAQDVSRLAVHHFPSVAARAAAMPSPVAGQVTYIDGWPDLHVFNGTKWMTRQGAYVVMSTDASSTIVLTYPKAFTAAPSLVFQGDATSVFTVLVAAFAGQIYADHANLVVRKINPPDTEGAPSTSVGFAWVALGPSS